MSSKDDIGVKQAVGGVERRPKKRSEQDDGESSPITPSSSTSSISTPQRPKSIHISSNLTPTPGNSAVQGSNSLMNLNSTGRNPEKSPQRIQSDSNPLPSFSLNPSQIKRSMDQGLSQLAMAPSKLIPEKLQNFLDIKKREPVKWIPKSLNEVLRKNSVLVYFMEFMDGNNASIYLQSWLTIESYRSLDLLEGHNDRLFDDARAIHDRFLVDPSLDLKVRKELKEKVHRMLENNEDPEVIFDVLFSIQKDVYIAMETNFFKAFLESGLFGDMQKELGLQLVSEDLNNSNNSGNNSSGFKSSPLNPTSSSSQSVSSAAQGGTASSNSQNNVSSATTQTNNNSSNSMPSAVKSTYVRDLKDILTNTTALFYFMQFADRFSDVKHMINFWLTVESYGQQRTSEHDDDILRQDTKMMYSLHFAPNATQPIKLNKRQLEQLRQFIENKPSANGTTPTFECVLRIQKEVFETMSKKCLKKFFESKYFADFRKECLKSQHEIDFFNPIISDNDNLNNDNNIDLYKTDSLKKMKKNESLNIGHLDELGFFVNDSENDADRDTFSEEIVEGATKTGIFETLIGGVGALGTDSTPNEDDETRRAREVAKNILMEVTLAVNSQFAEEDGI